MQKKGKKTRSFKSVLSEQILNVFYKNPTKVYNYKQLSSALHIEDQPTKLVVSALMADMADHGQITEQEKGKFKLNTKEVYITGVVDLTASGAAYIKTPDVEEDVYVSAKRTASAWHGDTVKVYLYPRRNNKKPEGEIVEILTRAKTEVVGTIEISRNFAFVIPDSNKLNIDVFVPLQKINGAKNRQKVVVQITEWPKSATKNPEGEILRVLGNPGDNDTEMHSILEEYGLPYEFPKDVERIADLIPTKITEEDIKSRRDFRDVLTFTIDPHDAKDFDDAISFQKLNNGNYEIGVHIADVSHYVKPGSLLDKEALSRATSIYLVDRVVPMLPEILSNNVCSLRPNEEKLCFAAVFEMTDDAKIIDQWFGRTIINSNRRFTYEEAQKIIETEEGDFSAEILTLDRLAKTLRNARFKNGSIGFDKIEVKFHIDEKGVPTGVYFKEQKDSNKLIEEFMLLANKKVAEFVGKVPNKSQKKTFVYRVHDKPDEEKLNTFAQFIYRFGYKISTKSEKDTAQSMNKLLKDIAGKKEENIIEQLAIRTMAKAHYTTENIGHYGLAFPHYSHFTSPIRRYPDVVAHRLLQDYLDGRPSADEMEIEEQCKHSSEMEKKAADAERASIKYKQVQFLQDKIGEIFEGVISGVTEWGLFVEIIDNKCEGLVRIRDIQDDFYEFDEDSYSITGRRNGHKYQLGDKIKIQVKRADLSKKQLDFLLVSDGSPEQEEQ